jgi:hypothetical protein
MISVLGACGNGAGGCENEVCTMKNVISRRLCHVATWMLRTQSEKSGLPLHVWHGHHLGGATGHGHLSPLG